METQAATETASAHLEFTRSVIKLLGRMHDIYMISQRHFKEIVTLKTVEAGYNLSMNSIANLKNRKSTVLGMARTIIDVIEDAPRVTYFSYVTDTAERASVFPMRRDSYVDDDSTHLSLDGSNSEDDNNSMHSPNGSNSEDDNPSMHSTYGSKSQVEDTSTRPNDGSNSEVYNIPTGSDSKYTMTPNADMYLMLRQYVERNATLPSQESDAKDGKTLMDFVVQPVVADAARGLSDTKDRAASVMDQFETGNVMGSMEQENKSIFPVKQDNESTLPMKQENETTLPMLQKEEDENCIKQERGEDYIKQERGEDYIKEERKADYIKQERREDYIKQERGDEKGKISIKQKREENVEIAMEIDKEVLEKRKLTEAEAMSNYWDLLQKNKQKRKK